jgi:GT2 family glycosyltransferase
LNLCLASLLAQHDTHFEIIIADDGSNAFHAKINKNNISQTPINIRYVYHEDLGFRAGTIRNKAVAISKGDYLIFIDGDCILQTDFISQHRQLAAYGYFVAGNRVLLNNIFTQEIVANSIPLHLKPLKYFILLRLQNKINRFSSLLRLPLGCLRNIRPRKWQRAITCNLAIWKYDFIQVNGFDELFEGWGYEDSDLVIRLIHTGIKRKEGRFAVPVLHLWHKPNDRNNQDANYTRLLQHINDRNFIYAEKGISQYIKSGIVNEN